MPLRLVHTSDIHLGSPFKFLQDKRSDHKKLIINAFKRIVDYCIKLKVDALLVSGDLFDSPYPSVFTNDLVKREIERLSDMNIHTILIPGNHDYKIKGIYGGELNNEFVHIIYDSNKYIKELDLTVYGNTIKEGERLKIKKVDRSSKFNIALVHGSLDIGKGGNSRQVRADELREYHFDYIALGDWHGYLKLDNNIYYSGSPEVLDTKQDNSGYFLDVIIDGKGVKVEKIRSGVIEIMDLEVDVSRFDSISDIVELIKHNRGDKRILNVRLTGLLNPNMIIDEFELKEELNDQFYYMNIYNQTNFSLTKEELNDLSSNFVIARYIKYLDGLRGRVDDDIIDKALLLGVNKLLKSNE
jgi:DNA repair exonuclease SbcCD nuclease subunit